MRPLGAGAYQSPPTRLCGDLGPTDLRLESDPSTRVIGRGSGRFSGLSAVDAKEGSGDGEVQSGRDKGGDRPSRVCGTRGR